MTDSTTPPTGSGPDVDQRPDDEGILQRFVRDIVTGQTLLITALAVLTALVFGAVLIILSEDATREPLAYLFSRPGDFFSAVGSTVGDAYASLFEGSLGGPRAWSETLVAATPGVSMPGRSPSAAGSPPRAPWRWTSGAWSWRRASSTSTPIPTARSSRTPEPPARSDRA